MRIELLHVMMVHFTVGLLITGVVAALVGDWRRWNRVLAAGQMAIWTGAAFAVLAVTTGLLADDRLVEDEAIGQIVDTHETLAFVTLGVMAAVAVGWLMLERSGWRWLRPWLHVLGVIGLGLIVATGYYGGDMVYEHAAAVHRDGRPVVSPSEHPDKPLPRSDAAGPSSPSQCILWVPHLVPPSGGQGVRDDQSSTPCPAARGQGVAPEPPADTLVPPLASQGA